MALLKKKKLSSASEDTKIQELKSKIKSIDSDIHFLNIERSKLEKELLEIQIHPFKIGGYAMAEVNAGKTKKMQMCLIENEGSTLYVRPIKANGELSNRHFSIIPVGEKSYSDFLKPVEE